MSIIRTKKIAHPSATEDQIVLNSNSLDLPANTNIDGDNLVSELASKLDSTAYQPGLVLITSQSFSAVSSVSVNGCFTNTYRNYRLLLTHDISTTGGTRMRLRSSGSDNTETIYDHAGITHNGVTPTGFNVQNEDYWGINTFDSILNRWTSLDLYGPQLAIQTLVVGSIGLTSGSDGRTTITSMVHTGASSFDGFSLIASTGTITGIIRVYGYRD